MLGHPPETLDPPANMDAAEPSLLWAVHYWRVVARARSPSRPRSPQSWADELRWGPGRLWQDRAPRRPEKWQVPILLCRLPPARARIGGREVTWGTPAARSNFRGNRPPGRPQTGLGHTSGLAGAPNPKRQPALALRPERRRPRPSKRRGTVELRAGEAAQATGPGPGVPEAAGTGQRVPRRGRPKRRAGGAARGPSPCKAAAVPPGPAAACTPASLASAPGRLPLPHPTRHRHLVYLPPPP